MRIVLDAVPPGGVPVTATAETDWAARAAAHAIDTAVATLAVDLRVRAVDAGARVDGTLKAAFDTACGRCGADLRYALSGEVDLDYSPVPPKGTDPIELDPDDMDVGWFDGHQLDLADVVSEQLGLWLPARIVCGDPAATRQSPGPCEVPAHDGGPALVRNNPFAALRKKQ
jgi:uncharacterized metal-binding protein YceD (DUF177 family)